MTRNSLPTRNDGPPERSDLAQWSTILMLLALPVLLASLLYSVEPNGLSLVTAILVILSIARRVVEYRRRVIAAQIERHDHE